MCVDRQITQVWCKICNDIEGRKELLIHEIDSLHKHSGRRKVLVDMGKIIVVSISTLEVTST